MDMHNEFIRLGFAVDIYDPIADENESNKLYGIQLLRSIPDFKYTAVVLAVAHAQFKSIDYNTLFKERGTIIFDSKSIISAELCDARL